MSKSRIVVTISVIDRMSRQLLDAQWAFWWWAWGTHGSARSKALVVLP